MNLNPRSLLAVLPILAIVGAFWFVVLAPARAEVNATKAEVLQATSRRDAAVASAAAAEQARRSYPSEYAGLARLAKSVPADEDVAALVRGLDSLARTHRLDFRKIALSEAVAKKPAPPSAPAGDAAAGDDAATDPAGADADAAAEGSAVAQAPAGAAVGSAGLLTMPFTFTAEGKYLPMQRFLKALHARAKHAGERVRVNGRLLTIDGFSFVPGRKGFPQLSAIISATAYLEPDPGGVIARSTPRRPAVSTAAVAPTTPLPVQGAAG